MLAAEPARSTAGILMAMCQWLPVAVVAAALGATACDTPGSKCVSCPTAPTEIVLPAGTLAFHASPVPLDVIAWITPLGNLNPPGHAVPTDHIYFYLANPDAGQSPQPGRALFFAPSDGTVTAVFGGTGQESKLYVRVTQTMAYYLDHLILDSGISVGTKLTSGQRVGVTGAAYAVDLGVVNMALTRTGLLNFSRYTDEDIHADAPLRYFDEPLRSQLYAKVQRIGGDLDGRNDYDIAGRLVGNWFVEGGGTPVSFAYNTYDPSQVRICVGGVIGSPIVWGIAPGDPLPRDVSVSTGMVRYTLTQARTGLPLGDSPSAQLLVQMTGESRIQAEVVPSLKPATEFSSAARFLIR